MRSIFVAILRGLLVVVVILAGVLLIFPEYRISLMGIRLLYEAPKEDKRDLLLSVNISEGREVRGQQSLEEEIPLSDSAKLEAALEETTLNGGSEFLLDYKLTQVQSEQFAWNQPKPGKLSGFHWQGRVSGLGNLGSVKLDERSNALWAREDVAWTWMSSLWPALPKSRLAPGDTWMGETRAFVTFPEKPEGFALILRPRFTLERIRREGGKTLAEFHWDGEVSGDQASGTVKGQIRGRAVTSLEDKRCLIAEFAVEAEGAAPLALAKGLEASDGVSLAWRQKITGRILRRSTAVGATPTPQ